MGFGQAQVEPPGSETGRLTRGRAGSVRAAAAARGGCPASQGGGRPPAPAGARFKESGTEDGSQIPQPPLFPLLSSGQPRSYTTHSPQFGLREPNLCLF